MMSYGLQLIVFLLEVEPQVNKLRQQLIQDINNSGLSVEAAMFVVKDVYRDIVEAYQQYEQLKSQEQKGEE